MFLHLGGDVVIPLKNIIAIMDIDTTTVSKDTKDFLRIAEEEGFIENISDDLPKSFIITEKNKKSKIYLSPISSVTLMKRSDYLRNAKKKCRGIISGGIRVGSKKGKHGI